MKATPRRPPPPLDPLHPERVCWGCDKYCPAEDLACGGGTIRTPHPKELFGADWLEWEASRARATDRALDNRTVGCHDREVEHPSGQ